MASIQNMTSGSPGKLIIKFAFPLMLGNLFQQCYTITDAAIVGQVLGVGAIAAIGAADWIIWLMLGVIQGITQGFAIWMAQEFGASNFRKLRQVIINSVFLTIISAVILTTVGVAGARWILEVLHTPDTVFPDALLYMRTMFWGTPVVLAYNLFASILRSLGDGKTPLYAMVTAALLNIALDILFVMGLDTGIFGAAAATVIAQFVSGLLCLLKILKIDILTFHREEMILIPSMHLHLLKLGAPMAFQNAVIAIGGMLLQSVVNGFGVIFIAGFTATNKLYGMLEVAATSYGFAMTTYSGQNLGAGKIDRIRRGYRSSLWIALFTSAVIAAFMIFGGKILLGFFISGDAKTVADTLEVAYHYLFIMSIFLPVLYYLHVTRSCIQGMGNTVLPMISGLAEFVMRTAAAFLLPLLVGQEGIFYAEIAAWAGADIVLFFSYIYCLRKFRTSHNGT